MAGSCRVLMTFRHCQPPLLPLLTSGASCAAPPLKSLVVWHCKHQTDSEAPASGLVFLDNFLKAV